MDISRYKRRTLSGEGMEEGKDGPLRDTDTNRDINTNRSFIFFYVPTRGTRRRRRRILTRTRLRPRENFLLPPSHQHALSTLVPQLYSPRFALRRCNDGEFYDSFVSSLYIRIPSPLFFRSRLYSGTKIDDRRSGIGSIIIAIVMSLP